MALIGAADFLDAICKAAGAQVAGFSGNVETRSVSLRDATRRKKNEKCHSEVEDIVAPSPLLDGRASTASPDGSSRRKKDLTADAMQSGLMALPGPRSLVSSPMRGRNGEEPGVSAPGRPSIAGIESCTEDTPLEPGGGPASDQDSNTPGSSDTNDWELMKN